MRGLPLRRLVTLATLAAVGAATLGTTAACGEDSDAAGGSGPVTLRLGYFPNITHAPAVVGVEKGIFKEKLGSDVELDTRPSTPARPPSRRSSPARSTPRTSARTRR